MNNAIIQGSSSNTNSIVIEDPTNSNKKNLYAVTEDKELYRYEIKKEVSGYSIEVTNLIDLVKCS